MNFQCVKTVGARFFFFCSLGKISLSDDSSQAINIRVIHWGSQDFMELKVIHAIEIKKMEAKQKLE